MTTVAEKKAFVGGKWQTEVDLVDFIKSNYTEYRGDASREHIIPDSNIIYISWTTSNF